MDHSSNSRTVTTLTDEVNSIVEWLCERIHELKPSDRPLVVCINGSQGVGKSVTANTIAEALSGLNFYTEVLSTDDFYLDSRHERLRCAELSTEQKVSPLYLTGRGLLTHDWFLMKETIQKIVSPFSSPVPIPRYDKSLRCGKGDRVDQSEWPLTQKTLDVVLIEGWWLGYIAPNSKHFVELPCLHTYKSAAFLTIKKELLATENDIYAISDAIAKGYEAICDQLTQNPVVRVSLFTSDISVSLDWRWQQEEALSKRTMKTTLNKEQVAEIMNRSWLGYALCWQQFIENEIQRNVCKGKSYIVELNPNRQVVNRWM